MNHHHKTFLLGLLAIQLIVWAPMTFQAAQADPTKESNSTESSKSASAADRIHEGEELRAAEKKQAIAQAPPSDSLVGTKATEFSGELAEGKLMKLSEFKDKKIVMLDFWATWCGPCRRALPLVSRLAEDYKDKGVVFFAVNVQEDLASVKEYLKKNNLSINVVLDRDGSTAMNYKVNAIPTTFVIDRQGIIRVMHRGFSPTIDKELSKELDLILTDKKD